MEIVIDWRVMQVSHDLCKKIGILTQFPDLDHGGFTSILRECRFNRELWRFYDGLPFPETDNHDLPSLMSS